jgi:hypothetical protein
MRCWRNRLVHGPNKLTTAQKRQRQAVKRERREKEKAEIKFLMNQMRALNP